MSHYFAMKQFGKKSTFVVFAPSLLLLCLYSDYAFSQAAIPASASTPALTSASATKDVAPAYLQNYKPSDEVMRQAEGPMRSILNAKSDSPISTPNPPPAVKPAPVKPLAKKANAKTRELDLANPNDAPGRIYPDDTAYIREKDGGINGLAVTLINQKASQLDGAKSPHKNVNGLRISSFGEYVLRGPSQNSYGFPATPKSRNKLGFNTDYIDDRAISQNVALFDYKLIDDGTPQNPSAVNDHMTKYSGSAIRGLFTSTLSYAVSDSGSLDDPSRAIKNGAHKRHVISVFPQDGVNGYVYTMDELQGAASAVEGQLAWHPFSDKVSFNANDIGNERYEWKIRQNLNTVDHLNLSIFMPTPPSKRQQLEGMFFDDDGKDDTSFVSKYLFNSYALPSGTKKRNVLTMFYPRKQAQSVPEMERIAINNPDGTSSQAAAFAFADGVTDFVFESNNTNAASTVTSANLDPVGTIVRGQVAMYRKINREIAFVFVGRGREFKSTASNPTSLGFRSDTDIDILMEKDSCVISTPKEVRVTILRTGKSPIPSASINGAPMTQVSGSKDWLYIRLPAGTHTIGYGDN